MLHIISWPVYVDTYYILFYYFLLNHNTSYNEFYKVQHWSIGKNHMMQYASRYLGHDRIVSRFITKLRYIAIF